MKLLEVVSPPSIYHGLYNQKTLWEDKFIPVNIRSCGIATLEKQLNKEWWAVHRLGCIFPAWLTGKEGSHLLKIKVLCGNTRKWDDYLYDSQDQEDAKQERKYKYYKYWSFSSRSHEVDWII